MSQIDEGCIGVVNIAVPEGWATKRREEETSQLNSQKTGKAGVKEMKRGISVVDLSDIGSIGEAKSEVVEQLSKKDRVLLTRELMESCQRVELLCKQTRNMEGKVTPKGLVFS